jgi:hypothetical protein
MPKTAGAQAVKQGDRVRLSDGQQAMVLEVGVATLRVARIRPDWPFPGLPESVLRGTVKRLPSRYLRETHQDVEPARW